MIHKRKEILEGIAIAKEVIHHCMHTNRVGYLLKLDFEKAYDIVNWDCLMEVLRLCGFGNRWISWIRMWLTMAKIHVLVNKVKGRDIVCKRGLHQEDPLSPLLFTMVADRMDIMLSNAVEKNMIEGLLKSSECEFVNLYYADDNPIFGNCDII